MQLLLVLMGAREVVEIGTLGAYSTIMMARALPEEGRIHTIERSDRHADFAADWIAQSDVSGRIELLAVRRSKCLGRSPRRRWTWCFLTRIRSASWIISWGPTGSFGEAG